MTDLTEATVLTNADLIRWYEMDQQLAALKVAESLLRKRIFAQYFPNPVEGSKDNKHDLADGTGAVMQATHVVNRKVLEADLDAYIKTSKEEGSNMPKLPINKLIKWKPELVKAEYNKLTDEERAACDLFLEIKDGSPQLEIKIPKRR